MAAGVTATKSRWWDGDAKQRYWMELVNVDTWGSELIAPDTPRYDLMRDVRVGDVVLHWVGKNNPMRFKSGMYGASIVAGELQPRAGDWYGKPANTIPLTNYTPLPHPYLLTDLRVGLPANRGQLIRRLVPAEVVLWRAVARAPQEC